MSRERRGVARARHGVWRWCVFATGVVLAVGTTARAEEPRVVVVSVERGSDVSAGDVERAIARELGEQTKQPGDPTAEHAVRLDVRSRNGALSVAFRDARGRRLVREVTAPRDGAARVSLIALLAGNLARNEADELLARTTPPSHATAGTIRVAATARGIALPPPPPRAEEAAALKALQGEADAYERGARDYRDTVTAIVQSHYEAKKQAILLGADREIASEKRELGAARETAILRLEEFIAKYEGSRAAAEATPDAMYQLAAIYEERARSEEATQALSVGLEPSIALYRRVVREYPRYHELAGVFYFLGHAYEDAGRSAEAQQVWRSLVCQNLYAYPAPADPNNPRADLVIPLPQDNDEGYWAAWRRAHPDPRSLKSGGPDTVYVDPYPSTCVPVTQPGLRPGEAPKYVGEAWWQIGNWEFDQQDLHGGYVRGEAAAVYDYDRAASAYVHSLESSRAPLYGVALYKYAWTLFKQQRYEAATRELVRLLGYTDDQQKLTGDPGADFRSEAYAYIAASLTHLDFTGPGPAEPYIARPDILETEPRTSVAEAALHVAIDRVQDATLVPQDKPWTSEIYRSLAAELRSMNQLGNALEVYADVLRKWPMDPKAPDVQSAIAETLDQLQVLTRVGTPEHEEVAQRALYAKTRLADYVGNTPWTDANKDNPAALQSAERLARDGLRLAAVTHTNNGRSQVVAAGQTKDATLEVDLLRRARTEYALAARGWLGFLELDESAVDAYETRYWLADARHQGVKIAELLSQLQKGRAAPPTPHQIEEAKATAAVVRDSDEDDRYLANAAFFVVDETDVSRDLEYQRYEDSKGVAGVQRRTDLRFDSADVETRKIVEDPVPQPVLASVAARDAYLARVLPMRGADNRVLAYQLYAAETFFLYGRFDEARTRAQPMYAEHCGKDEYGYKAWEMLLSMSTLSREGDGAIRLADAARSHPCCLTAEECKREAGLLGKTIEVVHFTEAAKVFEDARSAKPGDEANALWRHAAGMYEAVLRDAPASDAAPEAAMLGAEAYERAGELGKAVAMYNLLLRAYGTEESLASLQTGDAEAGRKRYAARLGYLAEAYDALAKTYYRTFDYLRAAETLDAKSALARFGEEQRRVAARNAMVLYAGIGERDRVGASHRTLLSLHPGPAEKASADFLLADYGYGQWNAGETDTEQSRVGRRAAEASDEAFYGANRSNAAAGQFALLAAYHVFRMKQVARDPGYAQWAEATLRAWELLRSRGPTADGKSDATKPPLVDYAAEAEFTLVDDRIRSAYDRETGRHTYGGSTAEVLRAYAANARDALKYDELLQHIVATYASAPWVAAAIARQGTLYDALRTGLYDATPPAVRYFSASQEHGLAQLESSGRSDLVARAQELRDTVKELWRSKKARELAGADALMVQRYATAVAFARQHDVDDGHVRLAIERLAYFTDVLGEAQMREYVTKTRDPGDAARLRMLPYTEAMYVRARPGLTAIPTPSATQSPAPLPVP